VPARRVQGRHFRGTRGTLARWSWVPRPDLFLYFFIVLIFFNLHGLELHWKRPSAGTFVFIFIFNFIVFFPNLAIWKPCFFYLFALWPAIETAQRRHVCLQFFFFKITCDGNHLPSAGTLPQTYTRLPGLCLMWLGTNSQKSNFVFETFHIW